LAIDIFRRLFFTNIKPPRRSRRLKGLPPENMEENTPLPPYSIEESPQQSEVQDTTTSQEEVPTPLENFWIFSESPEAFCIPEGYERRVLQLNSTGEFVVVNSSDIPAGSHQNPLVMTLFGPQTLFEVHRAWCEIFMEQGWVLTHPFPTPYP
jgi:hypothetical protein